MEISKKLLNNIATGSQLPIILLVFGSGAIMFAIDMALAYYTADFINHGLGLDKMNLSSWGVRAFGMIGNLSIFIIPYIEFMYAKNNHDNIDAKIKGFREKAEKTAIDQAKLMSGGVYAILALAIIGIGIANFLSETPDENMTIGVILLHIVIHATGYPLSKVLGTTVMVIIMASYKEELTVIKPKPVQKTPENKTDVPIIVEDTEKK